MKEFIGSIQEADTLQVISEIKLNSELVNTCFEPNTSALVWLPDNAYTITPLMLAAQCGFNDIIDTLIEHGANLNAQDQEGMTALFHAVRFGQTQTVDHLIQYYSIDLKHKNIHGFSTLLCAMWAGQSEMASHLLIHYHTKVTLNEKTNNSFSQTIRVLYDRSIAMADKAVALQKNYNDPLLRENHENGYDVYKVLGHNFKMQTTDFKSSLIQVLKTAQSQPNVDEVTEALKILTLEVIKSAGDSEKLMLAMDNINNSLCVTAGVKKQVEEPRQIMRQFSKIYGLLKLAQQLLTISNEGSDEVIQSTIQAMPAEALFEILHWSGIAENIKKLNNPDISKHLFAVAIQKEDLDGLAKLFQSGIITRDDVMGFLLNMASENKDNDEIYQKICYFSLALANSMDELSIVGLNMQSFLSVINQYIKGNNCKTDPAKWMVIHALIDQVLVAGEGELSASNLVQQAQPNDALFKFHLNAPLIFLNILQLSDRGNEKLIFLQRYAEILTEKALFGMGDTYSHATTPYLLLKELFGAEALVESSVETLVGENMWLLKEAEAGASIEMDLPPSVFVPLQDRMAQAKEAEIALQLKTVVVAKVSSLK